MPTLTVNHTAPHSIVSTIDHDLHRKRRGALNHFFSVGSIRRLEPIMKTCFSKLLQRLEQAGEEQTPVQIHTFFKACASDIITMYAFGECMDFMDQDDLGNKYFGATDWFFRLTHVFALAPGLVHHAQNVPKWLLRYLAPFLMPLRDRQEYWIEKVRRIRHSSNPEAAKGTIFEGILNSSLPTSEKSDLRLASEAQLIVFAGEGTTGMSSVHFTSSYTGKQERNTMALAILTTSSSLTYSELASAGVEPTSVAVTQLDNLPFLSAIIQEAIRLHPGVMARQVRISPDTAIVYVDSQSGKQYLVPPGTVTSMSSLDTHLHPVFGDDSHQFRPQRWIDDPTLNRYFTGFSRGSRNCIGMTLARREMAMAIAVIFSRYDVYTGQKGPTLEVYETDRTRDIDPNSDYIIPFPAKGSKGLQIRVRT
ncbi:MAG: hypothetical protein M1828_001117 [Chrysothrix sp. TS-e1954]|nr:MAG: hypothetical protein M1828_001117 [Chrysothrix sp. TS-e1954]